MSDEPSFDFLPWEELPVGVRRNRKKMYNYLVSVLGGGPTPTGSGTVTVTVQDSEGARRAGVYLCDTNQIPTEDDSNVVAYGLSTQRESATLTIYDTSTHQPTEETAIPYGDYYLFVIDEDEVYQPYSGTLTVDGDETVTITLTSE